MEKIAIITEYNPFHKGHQHQIEELKKQYPEAGIIVIMSGNAVQRGEFSIIDKFSRARAALDWGIDVIVELPVFYSINGANEFAHGALKIINYLKISKICFGSETNNKSFLQTSAEKIIKNDKKIKLLIKENNSYPKSIEAIIGKKLAANDILGVCYIKEIKLSNYEIDYILIKRKKNQYQNASAIRDLLIQEKNTNDNLTTINKPIIMNDYSDLIIGKIVSTKTINPNIKYLQKIIHNNNIKNFDDLILQSTNNSLTAANIRRNILRWILEIEKPDYFIPRILGINNKGQKILKEWKQAEIKVNIKYNKNYKNEINLANFINLKHPGIKEIELSSLILKQKNEY